MLHQLRMTTYRCDPIIVAAAAVPRVTDESLRLAALRRFGILDSPPEADFDRIAGLAADLFDAPVSVIGFVDHDRIWFKSHHGLSATRVDRAAAGRVAVLRSIEVQSGQTAGIRTFTSQPTVEDGGLRCCIAVPLCTDDGFDVGTLCVLDRVAIMFDEKQVRQLKVFSEIVMDLLEHRASAVRAVARAVTTAREADHRVMNSLQFVSSLLHLQSRVAQLPETVDQLAIAAQRVAVVARVHRHFVVEEVASEVPILSYLRRLCGELSSILGAGITVEGVETDVPSGQLLALGLITHELLTNARKHGAGTVAVAFAPAGAGVNTLCVTDEGEGLEAGFAAELAGGGLGLKVVLALVSQLNGKLAAGPNPSGRGARFTVTFPAA
jgi:two-component sensor histidine kinase